MRVATAWRSTSSISRRVSSSIFRGSRVAAGVDASSEAAVKSPSEESFVGLRVVFMCRIEDGGLERRCLRIDGGVFSRASSAEACQSKSPV